MREFGREIFIFSVQFLLLAGRYLHECGEDPLSFHFHIFHLLYFMHGNFQSYSNQSYCLANDIPPWFIRFALLGLIGHNKRT